MGLESVTVADTSNPQGVLGWTPAPALVHRRPGEVSLRLRNGKLFMELGQKRIGGRGRKEVIPEEVHQWDKGTKPECCSTYSRPGVGRMGLGQKDRLAG